MPRMTNGAPWAPLAGVLSCIEDVSAIASALAMQRAALTVQRLSMAKAEPPAAAPSLASATTDEAPRSLMPTEEESSQQLASTPDLNPGDSHAVIKRLESQVPTTAVWSEPEHGTTVIWLPSDK